MREKQEIDDDCYECKHFHHTPERQYLSNGDPGYPEENDCDMNWECPFLSAAHCIHCNNGTCEDAYEGLDEDGCVECDGYDDSCSYFEVEE